ncbi:hypothetical protein JTB14_014191 [Gonioctena quinquepunctata]|nr:hypothetical protein JTB14_014191 [Gonioctena quinquepunctata]
MGFSVTPNILDASLASLGEDTSERGSLHFSQSGEMFNKLTTTITLTFASSRNAQYRRSELAVVEEENYVARPSGKRLEDGKAPPGCSINVPHTGGMTMFDDTPCMRCLKQGGAD